MNEVSNDISAHGFFKFSLPGQKPKADKTMQDLHSTFNQALANLAEHEQWPGVYINPPINPQDIPPS